MIALTSRSSQECKRSRIKWFLLANKNRRLDKVDLQLLGVKAKTAMTRRCTSSLVRSTPILMARESTKVRLATSILMEIETTFQTLDSKYTMPHRNFSKSTILTKMVTSTYGSSRNIRLKLIKTRMLMKLRPFSKQSTKMGMVSSMRMNLSTILGSWFKRRKNEIQ